jgi:hypothetical protein
VPTTDWVQLDGFRTREEHRITPRFTDLVFHFHDEDTESGEHGGPITEGHFVSTVYQPAMELAQTLNVDQVNDRRISYVYLQEWLSTLGGGGGLGGDPNYDSAAQFWGSAAGVHDFNPLAWEAEHRAAALADFDASPPPGVTSRYFEWATNPFALGAWGTYTNRTIEVNLDPTIGVSYDRDGDPGLPGPADTLEHGLIAMGRDGEPPVVTEAVLWDEDEDWYVFGGFDGSLLDVVDQGEVLEDIFTAQIRIDLTDEWWAANAYPTTGTAEGVPGTTKETLALPLVLGPSAVIARFTSFLPTAGEFEESWEQTGSLFFEHDWTPPPYRIVYTTTPVAPVLRHYPRDGDGRGWGGVTRGYPPPRGRRGYGGARQP